jgi:hypothetical protein
MKDVTHLILLYRECARTLWNMFFQPQLYEYVRDNRSQWDIIDGFHEISTMLFTSLILAPLDRQDYKKSHSYEGYKKILPFLHVVPDVSSGVSISINREVNTTSGYWDYPVKCVKPADADMRFVDFFDFDVRGMRDFEYYHVRIIASPEYPDLIGRDALIRPRNVRVLHDEKEMQKDAGG